MDSVTVSVDQLVGWVTSGYVLLHILFGLATHYHSVLQVRKYNAKIVTNQIGLREVSPFKMCVLFAGRMMAGLPWFAVRSIIAPVGSQWHMRPEQISTWG